MNGNAVLIVLGISSTSWDMILKRESSQYKKFPNMFLEQVNANIFPLRVIMSRQR